MQARLPIALLALVASACLAAPAWHQDLYLGNDGYWQSRIEIDVRNDGKAALSGTPVSLRIGNGEGEAQLAGASADALRVCTDKGVEMLWAVTGPDGASVIRGPIPDGGLLTIPVDCEAESSATYYAYFDNAKAWRVPDFLPGAGGLRNGCMEEGTGAAPVGWVHDGGDETHRASWVTENPRSGARCLKTVVAEGAEPTWIATRPSPAGRSTGCGPGCGPRASRALPGGTSTSATRPTQ